MQFGFDTCMKDTKSRFELELDNIVNSKCKNKKQVSPEEKLDEFEELTKTFIDLTNDLKTKKQYNIDYTGKMIKHLQRTLD